MRCGLKGMFKKNTNMGNFVNFYRKPSCNTEIFSHVMVKTLCRKIFSSTAIGTAKFNFFVASLLYINLTPVGFRTHVKIASRIVSYQTRTAIDTFYSINVRGSRKFHEKKRFVTKSDDLMTAYDNYIMSHAAPIRLVCLAVSFNAFV